MIQKKLIFSLLLLQGCSFAAPINPASEATSVSSYQQGGQNMTQALQTKQWLLVSYLKAGNLQSATLDHPATLVLNGRKASGNASCNQYFASYQATEQGAIQFSQVGSTMMACQGEAGAQEQQYLSHLAEIHFYKILGDQLHLLDENKQQRLVFKMMPIVTLQGQVWQATGINNGHGGVVSNAITERAFLEFTADSLQGSSGCNSLRANYQVTENKLDIDPILSTKKMCATELMQQEQQMTQALGEVTHYEIRRQELRLVNAQGSLMMSFKVK